MQFTGRYVISAPPDAVWSALNDPATLKACIPGCEELEKAEPATFTGSVKLKIGPMSANFKGKVELTEPEPPRRCVLKGEGQGGVAGFARGESEVLLTAEGSGTMLSYTAKATVGGRLAQIGQRLLDSASRQLADEFFGKFAAQVAGKQAASISPSESAAEAALAAPPQVLREGSAALEVREGVAPKIWVIGLMMIVVVLLILFGLVLQDD